MAAPDTIEFLRITDALGRLYPKLPNYAATVAVNFFKERFVVQRDINNRPFKKRKDDSDKGRAILVGKGTGILKRDIHKQVVTDTYAIIGTSKLTAPYAKAHNQGFKGTVTVRSFTRRRYKKVKEKYTTKKGNERTRTSKQVNTDAGVIKVGTHRRKVDLPARTFMGVSAFLDRRIQATVTKQITQTIIANSTANYGKIN